MAQGAAVPFSTVSAASGDVSYDAATNAFTLGSAGTYLFIWNVLASAAEVGNDIVFTLTNEAGTNLAFSGKKFETAGGGELVSGSAAVTAAAGDTITLRNGSSQSVTLSDVVGPGANGFVSSMTVVRLS